MRSPLMSVIAPGRFTTWARKRRGTANRRSQVCGEGVSWDPDEAWDLANQNLNFHIGMWGIFPTRNWGVPEGTIIELPNGQWKATICVDFEYFMEWEF